MFDDFDKEEKADVEFQNPKFIIKVKDIKKTFNVFYIQFIIIIISFNIFKREKINYLRKLIINRLKYRIFDYFNFISYREFVISLR